MQEALFYTSALIISLLTIILSIFLREGAGV